MTITAKTSSIISSQVPDFMNTDYPLFIKFLESYYEYLEHQSPPIVLDLYVDVPDVTMSSDNKDSYGLAVESLFIDGEIVEQKADPDFPNVVTASGEVYFSNLSNDKGEAELSLINIGGRDKKFIKFKSVNIAIYFYPILL